ncbi:MAG: hypothetical protein KF691_11600 [Phycisphaeraceae bacterium]|nr:hypothetical protein [Phycisphaeraceae bacterium]
MKSSKNTGENAPGAASQGPPPRLRYVDVVELSHRQMSAPRRTEVQTSQTAKPARRTPALSVEAPTPAPQPLADTIEQARAAIAEANREASRIGLGPRFFDSLEETRRATPALLSDDARWVFAVRVKRELQGGRAAIIAPESRNRLLGLANRLGLRNFDANLVIAIVQDDARLYGTALPIPSEAAKGPLALVRPANPTPSSTSTGIWMSLGASVGLAAIGCYWLAMWFLK